MLIHKSSIISLFAASSLAAQQTFVNARPCSPSPGAAFGVAGYNCANCGFKTETGKRTEYTFFASPVVTDVSGGPIEAGDVLEAIDGNPIVTRAGSDMFAYPENGEHTITVRRGRDRKDLRMTIATRCNWVGDTLHMGRGIGVGGRSASGGEGRGTPSGVTISGTARGVVVRGPSSSSRGGAGRGVGVPAIGGEPIYVVDGARVDSNAKATVGKFGFAIECRPSCKLKQTAAGQYYYKYDEPPRIVEIRDRSLAEKAGLEIGDYIVKIEGRPITDDAAGIIASEDRQQLRMTIRREGKEIDVLMSISKSE